METAEPTTKDLQRLIRERRAIPHAYVILLGLNVFDVSAILKAIDRGLPWKAFTRFVRNTGLPPESVAELVGVPRRTLARRKSEGRFRSDESDRLLRAARIFSSALDLYGGNREAAAAWLSHPNWALGGSSPLEFARTEIGAKEVEHLVGRIQHGIVS
jgi:putative toxin-antitoxin system antitoxin component (TIGR02293 family)